MKKLTTLMACLCLGGAAMMATPVTPAFMNDGVKIKMTEAQRQNIRSIMATNMVNGPIAEDNAIMTRTWTNPSTGEVWTLQLLKLQPTIPELVGFQDDEGNDVQYSFDELPFYAVQYVLWGQKSGATDIGTQLGFVMCWPSEYIYEQVFEYGTMEIPIEERKYECVSPDRLMNNAAGCRTFQEAMGIGGTLNEERTQWASFTMLPNAALGFVGMVDGQTGYTTLTETIASRVIFKGFNSELDNTVEVANRIYFTTEAGSPKTQNPQYVGPARVEGFSSNTYNLPEFGMVHLFNMGLGGRDIYGEEDLYPVEWGPLSQFYVVAGDKYLVWHVDPSATKFNKNVIQLQGMGELPANEDFATHANYVKGVLYANVKYSEDQTLNPSELIYTLVEAVPEYDEDMETEYLNCKPIENSMVPYGWEPDWSEENGMQGRIYNFTDYPTKNSVMVFGSKEGFKIDFVDSYTNKITAFSTDKVRYYYNPDNIQQYRDLDSFGDIDYSAVEVVENEAANVTAAFGVITVVPAETANVAVYALSGAVLANTTVAAGQTFSVEAAHGVYVVVVNGKACKVAL